MTQLVILSEKERALFDSPAKFNFADRSIYFALDQNVLDLIKSIRTPTNKVGFMLQYGHFKSNGKFYTNDQFSKQDINHIMQQLNVNHKEVNIESYSKNIQMEHRIKILAYFKWKTLSKTTLNEIFKYLLSQAQNQISPRELFDIAIDYCWNNKIELHSCNQLTLLITDAYNEHELLLLDKIKNNIDNKTKNKLKRLMQVTSAEEQKPLITFLKQVSQSLKPMQIKENVEVFSKIQDCFYDIKDIIEDLALSDQAVEYYATWIQKAQTTQIKSLADSNKLYLYLMAFIKHQNIYRSDTLVDIFTKSVLSAMNRTNKILLEKDKTTKSAVNKSIKNVTGSHKDHRTIVDSIDDLVRSPVITYKGKVTKIISILDEFKLKFDTKTMNSIIEDENSLNKASKDHDYYNILESLSVKLQLRVSGIVKLLDFNTKTSDSLIIDAIEYFRSVDGNIDDDAPLDFLDPDEVDIIFNADNKIRVSLYKILLFIHIYDRLKSGKLNLKYSYHYKAFNEYLIKQDIWNSDREQLITNAGLGDFSDFRLVIKEMEQKLDARYDETNKNVLSEKNKHVTIDEDTNKIKLKTPKASNDENEYISGLLSNIGYLPILQILSDINNLTNFTDGFKHHSNKFKKMRPSPEVIFAGILGKGCNIGINKIANISVGITEGALRNAVNWCFVLKNIQAANNKILNMLNKLSLADSFKKELNKSHTGSDGSKYNTAVDSLNANYSFKYFGKGKGSTIYTFLDERGALFYSTVISSSEREAAYVIDGLLNNDVIKSSIHSTDTHGYTEIMFGAMHFIGTSFAPRIKNITKQKIYSFKSRSYYQNKGYNILPSRTINTKLIEKHWDDILRFMATIKLKHATASTLFKRLSSYAKDHPLYKALKEFGRIIKSLFVLTYYDDVKLRQSIEKQLNKVELSNKFSRAVFFANNQEFQYGEKHEQEINAACMSLIQNAIVLWNYLYLSQLLVNNSSQEQRDQMIRSIKSGSAITWHHVNLHGEYDFTKNQANDARFEMAKILELDVK